MLGATVKGTEWSVILLGGITVQLSLGGVTVSFASLAAASSRHHFDLRLLYEESSRYVRL